MSTSYNPSPDSLHQEFRMLTALLTLVTAINNNGQPKLGDIEGRGRICNGLLDDSSSRNKEEVLFSALPDLLVRDAEVIAIIPEQLPAMPHVAKETVNTGYNFLAVYGEEWPTSFGASFHRHAAIGNPDRNDAHFRIEDGDVVLVEDGKSFWNEIMKNPWCKLDQSRRAEPLANHIKTLCDYLQSYQDCGQDDKLRASVFQTATNYLISSSWRKMLRRMRHWSSQGFLTCLEITMPELRSSYKDFHRNVLPSDPIYQKPDTSLARLFLAFSQDDIAQIVKNHSHFSGVSPKLPNLRNAFHDVLAGSTKTTGYTADSYVEFHQLLLAVLFGYEEALTKLDNLKSQQAGFDLLVSAATEVWNLAHLLWRIACSRTLRYHLAVLKFGKLLVVPTFSMRIIYSRTITFTRSNSLCRDGDTSAEKGPVATGMASGEEAPDEADIANLNVGEGNPDVAIVFLKWFRLHVNQFMALNSISAFCARSPSRYTLNISLLAVRSPPRSINSWEEAIQKLASLHPSDVNGTFDAKASIDFIKNKADIGSIRCNILQNLCKASFDFSGTVHCEAALASLSKYPECVGGPPKDRQRVLELLKKTNTSLISVSKLCCPVCWDLLDVLRSGNSNLMKVRGRHTAISPVHLPSWLPSEVMEHMVTLYQTYLYQELVKMGKHVVNYQMQKSLINDSQIPLLTPLLQSSSGLHFMHPMPVPET